MSCHSLTSWSSCIIFLMSTGQHEVSIRSARGQSSSVHCLTLLTAALLADSWSKSWRWKRAASWLTIFFRVRNAEMTWKVRKTVKMICIAFSKGRFLRPSLRSKKSIKGNCSRRLRSQKPASSGTCSDTARVMRSVEYGFVFVISQTDT